MDIRYTSPQASYRLRRFFIKVIGALISLRLLFRKRLRLLRLFACKRAHNAFAVLPTFCGRACGAWSAFKSYNNLDKFIDEYNSLFGKAINTLLSHLVGNWLGKTEDGFICQLLGEKEIREIYKKILYYPTPLHNISHAFLNPGGRVCYSGRRNTLMFSSGGAIHKCTLLSNTPGSQLGNITDDGDIKDYDYSGAQKWLCYEENCKNIKGCFYSPICFGDSCPSAHSGMYQYEKAVTGCPHEKTI